MDVEITGNAALHVTEADAPGAADLNAYSTFGAAAASDGLDDANGRHAASRGAAGGRGRGSAAAIRAADAVVQLPFAEPQVAQRGRGRPRGRGNRGNAARGPVPPILGHRQVLPAVHPPSSDEDVANDDFFVDPYAVDAAEAEAWRIAETGQALGGFIHGRYHRASQHLLRDYPETQGPMFFLNLFFGEDWWRKICDESNRFMHQANVLEVRHTTVDELKRWFGLLMIIAHYRLPNLDTYWKPLNHSLPHLLHPCFRNIMTRERFSFLSNHIHLVNNYDDVARDNPARDSLFKLRWVVDSFNSVCKKVWQLGLHVSPDEGLIPTYSPNPIESFCPKPGGSYGVLIRFTCCAEKWFCYHIFIEDKKSRTMSEKLDLMLEGVKPGQICYIDRFYTTFDTVCHLHSKGFGVVGTCMANRFPPHPSVFKLPDNHVRGDFVACTKGPIVALLWHDSDVVRCLCNVHGNSPTSIQRLVSDGTVRDVPGPACMKFFGKFMQGGDRMDQLRSGHYGVSHNFRTSKWWLKAFLGIVDLALANAWVLFKETRHASHPRPSHSEFWLEIATALVAKQPGILLGSAVPHSLRTFAPTDGSHGQRRKRPNCVVCKLHGKLARTTYGCVTCRVALHPECAAEWPHIADPDDMKDYVFDQWTYGEGQY
jgi:hypothetical protein